MKPGKLGVSAAGDVYLVGAMTGVVDFGGGQVGSAGAESMYLAALAP